ncbi:MAG: hypothetical protein E7638_01780 [Ruminococcaceae bacterium]|nr:hypothetical protein [Oscillospiraceae bacterium]
MDRQKQQKEEIEIDLLHLLGLLWKKAWIIVLSMILLASAFFSYSMFMVTPQYKSTAMMYVNNSTLTVGSTSIGFSSGQLTAARSLLDTYVVILKTRTTFEKVIEKADLDLTYKQLQGMVSASAVNETDVFSITATSSDPAEAELIVDTIVEILPDRIADIVDGSSVRVVDHAILPTTRSSPSYTKYAMIGMVVGLIASAAVVIIIDLMDTSVRDEEYLNQTYDIPVLAVIPDVYNAKEKSYGRYRKSEYYGKAETSDRSKSNS